MVLLTHNSSNKELSMECNVFSQNLFGIIQNAWALLYSLTICNENLS